MKILHIIDSTGFYGAESMLMNLMEEQRRMGHYPLLVSTNKPQNGENAIEVESIKRGFFTTRITINRGFSLKGALQIINYAKENAIDIIHSHGYKVNILLGALPHFVRNIPMVSTVHGYLSVKRFTRMWLYKIIDTIALKRIEAVVYVYTPRLIINEVVTGKKKRSHIINNGIPELNFDHKAVLQCDPEIAKFCSNGFIVGTLCRLSVEKGIDQLIKAIQILSQRNANIKAVVIGEGPQRQFLQKMIDDANLTLKVKLAGYREQAYNYLPMFNVFALPSLTEGLPITILEAMQAKVPIIATRVGGIPDVLENGSAGILIETMNPMALADAIHRVWSDPSSAKGMAERARSIALVKYSCKRMAEDYLSLYRDILN